MPAIVRVKRRIDEEPYNAFVLNGKKRRMNTDANINTGQTPSEDNISTILKFAGTIKEQDNVTTTKFAARLKKSDANQIIEQKSSRRQSGNVTERVRKELRQLQQEQRFRIVNCLRTTLEAQTEDNIITEDQLYNANASNGNTAAATEITIVDIEPSATVGTSILDASNIPADFDTGYVYDLYLPEDEQQAAYVDMLDDNYLSVHVHDNLIFEDCYNNDDEDEYDSEDSNHENYFTNEYPDEEEDMAMYGDAECVGSDQELCDAVTNFVLDDNDADVNDDDYSSYSGDDNDYYAEPFVHTIEFVGALNTGNNIIVRSPYNHYRKRLMKYQKNLTKDDDYSDLLSDSDSDEEHYESASENTNE